MRLTTTFPRLTDDLELFVIVKANSSAGPEISPGPVPVALTAETVVITADTVEVKCAVAVSGTAGRVTTTRGGTVLLMLPTTGGGTVVPAT